MNSLPIIDSATTAPGAEAPHGPPFPASGPSLIELLLSEQQDLSAVDRFAQHHAAHALPVGEPFYRTLMPATPPGPGQQYGFQVDLDLCSGCKACVTGCHALNGLDDTETWRDVGLLVGGTRALPVLQHVTTACHHCLSPACMVACPVNAYEKDPATGIVKHLDDQCFGCQYCTMACPYDVPKYHAAKGIVRKCDMCATRLEANEAPACVQACPHQAISIQIVETAEVTESAEAALFLPAAPDPQITYPTTVFKSRRVFPRNMLPVDYFQVSAQHPHWPLVVMLVLTQLSVGAFATGIVLESTLPTERLAPLRSWHGLASLVFGLVAIGASTLHLGRPRYAYRALLGLAHSWMSREILAFGLFAALACAYAAAITLPDALPLNQPSTSMLGMAVVFSGASGIFGSIMIYATLGREYWSFTRTGVRFLLTSALLGTATSWFTASMFAATQPSPESWRMLRSAGAILGPALIALCSAKLLWEAALLRHRLARSMTQLKRSALLITGELASYCLARFFTGFAGGIVIPVLLLSRLHAANATDDAVGLAALACLLLVACLCGELLERYLFFAAVAAPRMPGGIR